MSAPLIQSLPPVGGWRVTSQTPGARAVAGVNGPVAGYTVGFVTGNGVNGSVFVPSASYSADNVKAAIAAQVAQLDAVSNLDHTS